MDWIDKLNKELQERRDKNKTSEAKQEAISRLKRWVGASGGNADSTLRSERRKQFNSSKRTMSDEDIINMKELYRSDISLGFPDLAKMYKVDTVTIHNIMHGLIYSEIGGEVEIRKPKKTCEHCPAPPMSPANYKRFHGDNCKHKN